MCVCVSRRVCVRVCVSVLGPCVCQDVSSFGNSLSRCIIFRQVAWLFVNINLALCVCHVDGSLCVSRRVCVSVLGPCVCQDVATACQDISSFVRFMYCL